MKKFLFLFLLLILLIVSFRGGAWYSQRWSGEKDDFGGERRILHYVDPMNPTNVSDKPGIAPCGMPMEPVYDDRESVGSGAMGPKGAMALGAVKVTPQKQQTIGVRIGRAEVVSETHNIRTLGRVAAEENRIFPLVSAVDGWMSYIPGSTTGSLVEKGQLMALIRVYDYDFFSVAAAISFRACQPGATVFSRNKFYRSPSTISLSFQTLPPRGAEPGQHVVHENAATPKQDRGKPPAAALTPPPKQIESGNALGSHETQICPAGNPTGRQTEPMPRPPISRSYPSTPASKKTEPMETEHSSMNDMDMSMQDMDGHSMLREQERRAGDLDPNDMYEDDILYANNARLELLNLGVDEIQLRQLAREGKYIPNIQLRSPVTGLVIGRPISPLEKVDRGTECFRVADLSRVWVFADVFNIDAKYIRPGMRARISFPRQNKSVEAVVSDIYPEFDAVTRTLKVRLEMDNPENVFRPDMFVDVDFLISLPPAITVPADAVLDSGRRKVVFVALEDGYFEPREVVTGWRFDDRVEIVKGLAPGEEIVVSGNFLIDSESRMKLATAGLMAKPETEKGSSDKEKADTPSSRGAHA